jgi:hypothetical protein
MVPSTVATVRDPGAALESAAGLSLATSIARSMVSAETIMYPPTISFTSTKGPSVAPVFVTTVPPGWRGAPMSIILSLNFSFHASNVAYISCICAGEGCCDCRGWLRWMKRYFGM